MTPDGKVMYRGGSGGPQRGGGSGTVAGNPAADYSEGASHVLAVIHEILAHHRAVEKRWSDKKLKLHQRLALRLFQEDVKQVRTAELKLKERKLPYTHDRNRGKEGTVTETCCSTFRKLYNNQYLMFTLSLGARLATDSW